MSLFLLLQLPCGLKSDAKLLLLFELTKSFRKFFFIASPHFFSTATITP